MPKTNTNTGLTIRPAARADLPAIVALYADDPLGKDRERSETPLPQAYCDAFDAINADPNNMLVVAERQGAVVGTLQLTLIATLNRQGGRRALIEAVHVAAEWRGLGIGGALMGWAIEKAREGDCRLVQLTTNAARPDAHRFYQRLGFVPSHIGMKLAP